jgi:hypothetical protein
MGRGFTSRSGAGVLVARRESGETLWRKRRVNSSSNSGRFIPIRLSSGTAGAQRQLAYFVPPLGCGGYSVRRSHETPDTAHGDLVIARSAGPKQSNVISGLLRPSLRYGLAMTSSFERNLLYELGVCGKRFSCCMHREGRLEYSTAIEPAKRKEHSSTVCALSLSYAPQIDANAPVGTFPIVVRSKYLTDNSTNGVTL